MRSRPGPPASRSGPAPPLRRSSPVPPRTTPPPGPPGAPVLPVVPFVRAGAGGAAGPVAWGPAEDHVAPRAAVGAVHRPAHREHVVARRTGGDVAAGSAGELVVAGLA